MKNEFANAMADVFEAADKVQTILRCIGFKKACVSALGRAGRSLTSQISFAIDLGTSEIEFEVTYDGDLIYNGISYRVSNNKKLGNIDDTEKITKELTDILLYLKF